MKILCEILDSLKINYNWYILGKAYTEEIEKDIKYLFNGNSKVHFLGYISNPYPYLKQMDYLALLSDRESWGLVLTESLILGVPCIVTNFEIVYKQIQDKKNGIILDLKDFSTYQERIDDIIHLKNKLKENIINTTYDMDYVLNEWKQLL